MKIYLTAFTFLFLINTNACLNLSGTNIDGNNHSIDELSPFSEPTDYPSKHSIYLDLSHLLRGTKKEQ